MTDLTLANVLANQQPSGGFSSYVLINDSKVHDENCFITALVGIHLLQLQAHKPSIPAAKALDQALDFVAACEDPEQPGAFRYYPYQIESPRLEIPLFNDLDDSALASSFLLSSGRRKPEKIRKHLESVFEKNRKAWINDTDPNWISEGAALTWATGNSHKNPIDACVNANVAALYAQLGLFEAPMYCSAIKSLERLATFWGDPSHRWRYVSPFYAHPIELIYAIERAILAGAHCLNEVLKVFQSYSWAKTDLEQEWSPERPICCNDSGNPIWYAPVLQRVRKK